jgi:[protein-PII] uridylyltransferase
MEQAPPTAHGAFPAAQVLGPGALVALRATFREGKSTLVEGFLRAPPTAAAAHRLVRGLSRHVDETLRSLLRTAPLPSGSALLAVGGYGRGELFPHSDIDVLVLLSQPTDTDGIGGFITACWDVGLEIGSSVRTLEECVAEAQRDITVQTALLESRLLAGSRPLHAKMMQATRTVLDPRAFLRAKVLELHQRHVKYENTPYALEPNCKESPGGLRDLQVPAWVALAAGFGGNWRELEANGLLTRFEVAQLRRNEGTLKLIRARLHAVAGRREDRLVFDLQTAVAESCGYVATRTQRASELLMHRYYWAAKAVAQLNQILLLNMEERLAGSEGAPMRPINERFLDRGGMLEVARDELYLEQPHAILETFLLRERTPGIQGLSARTLRALYNARGTMNRAFRHDPANRRMFMHILRQPSGVTRSLRLMNQTSVLGRYLWVFRRIVGRMQHDLFHVYTVDQHILMVVRNVRRFFIPEHAHEYPFCSHLASQWDDPSLLYIAALFHDVAKGRGGDHSDLGAREVRRFCQDHGVSREGTGLVEFLVQHHLTMSRIAQKEDLSDPEVIARFAQRVGNERRLTALYLLTVADIRGTSPKVWNAWKGKLLEDLYRYTLRALGGARPHLEADLEARKLEAKHLLALHSALPGTEEPLWKALDVSYFARHDAAELAWHARALWRHVKTAHPVVVGRRSPAGEGLQVLVYAPDRPDLFARICGYFDNAGFSILDARIHTTRDGYALDTFQVAAAHHVGASPTAPRDLISLVETQATQALASVGPLPEPARSRVSRRVKSFPVVPRVSLQPDERAQHWILSVSASDRSGLLYAIARVLARHGVNLQLAKVSTLGERVEDTFLVDGPALQHTRAQVRIETELLDAIG